MRRTFCAAVVAASVASLGCGPSTGAGGGGNSATCNQSAACGGNIVGTWAITEACNVFLTGGMSICVQQFSLSGIRQTGTFAFRADGTATYDLAITGTLDEVVAPACLGDTFTCETLDASIREMVAEPDSGYSSGSCMTTGAGCSCRLMLDAMATTSLTYTTSGTTLMQTVDGMTSSASYCVFGSTLIVSIPSPNGGPPAVYVLTKQ